MTFYDALDLGVQLSQIAVGIGVIVSLFWRR